MKQPPPPKRNASKWNLSWNSHCRSPVAHRKSIKSLGDEIRWGTDWEKDLNTHTVRYAFPKNDRATGECRIWIGFSSSLASRICSPNHKIDLAVHTNTWRMFSKWTLRPSFGSRPPWCEIALCVIRALIHLNPRPPWQGGARRHSHSTFMINGASTPTGLVTKLLSGLLLFHYYIDFVLRPVVGSLHLSK
jgi:hypothetical protein